MRPFTVKYAVVTLLLFVVPLSPRAVVAAELGGGTLSVARDEAASDCPDDGALARATLELGRPWARADGAQADLGLCAGFLVGRIQAEGRGYLRSETANDAWFALQGGGRGRWSFSPNLAIALEISLLVPTRRQEFTVANAGVAFESHPIAGLLELGPELRFP